MIDYSKQYERLNKHYKTCHANKQECFHKIQNTGQMFQ